MPLCVCGHEWGDHASEYGPEDADIDNGKRPCIGTCDDCQCPNYEASSAPLSPDTDTAPSQENDR